jgi:hypothetical protein
MIGHKWAPAEGTVVTSHSEQMELPGKHGMHWVAVHDIDVRTPDGEQGRARVPDPDCDTLHPGTVVRLEINEKTGEIRLNPHRDKRIVSFGHGYVGTDPDDLASPRPVPTVTVTGPGGAGFAQIFGGAQVVIGGNDASDVLRTLMSGDPADRAAAKERLRELAQSQGQGHTVAFGGLAGLAADGGFSTPADGGFSTPADGGFSAPASPSDRLAVLEQMLERGQLSQAEFDAKRQQILDQI